MTKILVADDDPMVHELLAALLSAGDRYIIMNANDGREAKCTIPEIMPDLVITDFNMPGLSGIELTKWIKTQYPGIRVILISNQDIKSHPADDFVSKLRLFEDIGLAVAKQLKR